MNDTHDSHHTQHTAANNDVGEDGLGYYPSGAKRTLTDQQIAMFRHSEIYGIIRARQVKRENEEFDSEQVADEISAAEASSSKDGTPAAPVHAKEESSVAAVTGGRVGEGSSRNKRRKLNRQRSTQASGQDVPSRRVIREMDNVGGGDEGELDY